MDRKLLNYFKENNCKVICCDYFDNLLNNYTDDELQDCYCFLNNNSDYITFDELLNSDFDGESSNSTLYVTRSGGEVKYLFVDCSMKFICKQLGI